MARVPQKFEKIAFVASDVPEAKSALETLAKLSHAPPKGRMRSSPWAGTASCCRPAQAHA